MRGCSFATYEVIPKGQGREAHCDHVVKDQCNNQVANLYPKPNVGGQQKLQIGQNVSRKDKIKFLVTTLLDLKDSKEAIYSALDAWVAWEQNFPIGPLKNVILALEKEHQWHRIVQVYPTSTGRPQVESIYCEMVLGGCLALVLELRHVLFFLSNPICLTIIFQVKKEDTIQVIKWMLSKGQGNTMGTYGQLLRALDMDNRADEAHQFWVKKVSADLHSVPWQLCGLMISVYYRNNMLENLVKLFKGLEAFGRKPTDKSIVQRVADAYEMLGLLEEKERVLEKYKDYLYQDRESLILPDLMRESRGVTETLDGEDLDRDRHRLQITLSAPWMAQN
ncbi:hypothetical protein GOBAR_DD12118 [Gossypium barbadense]|nr:hypothetical protein GOBAR_DD12118 [Gossypium barbadense]